MSPGSRLPTRLIPPTENSFVNDGWNALDPLSRSVAALTHGAIRQASSAPGVATAYEPLLAFIAFLLPGSERERRPITYCGSRSFNIRSTHQTASPASRCFRQ